GVMPIYEPGLEELVRRNVKAGRLTFTTSYTEGLKGTEYAFIAVGTPSTVNGEADLQYVAAAARSIAENMTEPLVIVNKSTVPVGTGDWVADIVTRALPKPVPFSVVSCPEFLREGSAIGDFISPHRTVIGSLHRDAAEKVAQLHLPLRAPILITDLRTAEMIKYASNAFLATKISFINEVADICEALGADVKEVAAGMGYDKRIGSAMLDAGLGWGGSCFPKDVKALAFMAEEKGLNPRILHSIMEVNYDRRKETIKHVEALLGDPSTPFVPRTSAARRCETASSPVPAALAQAGQGLKGKTVGLLGLAFKPNTDDMREAPSIDIVEGFIQAGATVRAFDPVAMEVARGILPAVEMFEDPYQMAKGCDALVVVTEWNEFKQLDLDRIKGLLNKPVIFDGRNIYDPARMKALGFTYRGLGRQ
ncbi:MAG: UDP-glucose/GDP-mannose dehydrogenase family protein, partial [Anaerolineales bacterium]|nr:UDP-glucose/GDP-mannose dehydrogenase family protein [Anaerolineales bacterium]